MLESVKWGEFRVGDLFEIHKTNSFNKDSLVIGNEYDYITRTSENQGVLQTTGYVNGENINPAGIWSLGLLQMDFFYREKEWYAGQFVRKVSAKFGLTKYNTLFFTSILNTLKPYLLTLAVRFVDDAFRNYKIKLPITGNRKINFSFMEKFIAELEASHIAELEASHIAELEAYLSVTGLNDYHLTQDEKDVLRAFEQGEIEWGEFKIADEIFKVKNSGNILARDIKENSGATPYLCASANNNAVSSYISYNEDDLDEGNCIFIGGKTFVVTYQEQDFYSNDSHNLILYLLNNEFRTKLPQLYLTTCIYKSLSHKYSWGDSISNKKIQKDKILLPLSGDEPNYPIMEIFIKAVQKLIIKDVVLYSEQKRALIKQVITKDE